MSENRPIARHIFVRHNTGNTEKILQASRKEKSSHIQRNTWLWTSPQPTLDARRPQCNVFKTLMVSHQEFYTQPNLQADKCDGRITTFSDMRNILDRNKKYLFRMHSFSRNYWKLCFTETRKLDLFL